MAGADLRDILDTMIAEAGGEGPEGMRRVAETILNRAAQRGLTPGQVVRQPNQYTGYWSPGPAARQAQRDQQVRTAAEAAWALAQQPGDPTNGADHYFNPNLAAPSWADRMTPTGTYGGHAFYSDRPVPAAALAALLTPSAVAPVPAGSLQRQFAYENSGRPQPQVPTPAVMSSSVQSSRDRNAALDALRVTPMGAANIADLYGGILEPSRSLTAPGGIDSVFSTLRQNPSTVAALESMLEPKRTNLAQSYAGQDRAKAAAIPAARVDAVGSMPSFNELSKSGVTRTADGIAGTVALPKGVRPNVTVPAPAAAQVAKLNGVDRMPAFSDLADMFGVPDRLLPSARDVDVIGLDVANPYGIDVLPLEDTAPTTRVAQAKAPTPATRKAQPQQRAPTPATRKATAVTRPAPVPASPALAYAPSSSGRQSSAASAIAKMFEPAGTLRAGTNGYAYAANGNGGYSQVGTFRPAGMTPQQQYDFANYLGQVRASESSGGSGSPGQGMSSVRGENRYDPDTNSWSRK